jgi:hypothetical protein
MNPSILLFLIFSLYAPGTSASDVEKKGYIINNNGDSVFGKILVRKELGNVTFTEFFPKYASWTALAIKKNTNPEKSRLSESPW